MTPILVLLATVAQVQGVPVWTVSAQPNLVIDDDGTPAREFAQIEGAFRLNDGRIAVINGGTNDVRIFDPAGRHLTSFGRSGAGPGEFRQITVAARSRDSVWLYDPRLKRVTAVHLGPTPSLAATVRVTAVGGREEFGVVGRLPDGRWLVTTYVQPGFDGPPGVYRKEGSIGLLRPSADGEVDWVGRIPSAAIFVHSPTGRLEDAAVGPIAFSPWVHSTTSGDQVWFGESGSAELEILTRTGASVRARFPFEAAAPTKSSIASERHREMARARRGESFLEAKYSAKYLPERLPYYGGMVAGMDGEVWVLEFPQPSASTARYAVLARNGTHIATVSVPMATRVRDIGQDYVLLVHTNEDGVESVRLHGLTRR